MIDKKTKDKDFEKSAENQDDSNSNKYKSKFFNEFLSFSVKLIQEKLSENHEEEKSNKQNKRPKKLDSQQEFDQNPKAKTIQNLLENYECERVVLEKHNENKDPMPLITLEALNAVPNENRLNFLSDLCAELSDESLTTVLPPNENSLASEDIKTSKEMLKVLADVESLETPKLF